MSLWLVLLLAWLVVLPLGFFGLVLLYSRSLRWRGSGARLKAGAVDPIAARRRRRRTTRQTPRPR